MHDSSHQQKSSAHSPPALYIIDGLNYLFRSYYAIRNLTNKEGNPTNALFGFVQSLQKLIKTHNPLYLIIVFDGEKGRQSRQELYPEYKENRPHPPTDLLSQIPLAQSYCSYAGLPLLQIEYAEADDTIGSIASFFAKKDNLEIYICSTDKDFLQLISSRINVMHPHKNNLIINLTNIEEIFHIQPNQTTDFLAIVGDQSDNIPGVPGCGPKTAISLLQKFGSLDDIFKHLNMIKSTRIKSLFSRHQNDLFLSKKLATIQTDLSIPQDLSFYTKNNGNPSQLKIFFQEMNFQSLLKQQCFPQEQKKMTYTILQTDQQIQKTLQKLPHNEEIFIDTETTSKNPMIAEMIGLGLGTKEEFFYIPFSQEMIQIVKNFLENKKISFIGHNIKYDMHVLLNYNIQLPDPKFDTMIASHLLNAHENHHSLSELTWKYFHYKKTTFNDLFEKTKSKNLSDLPLDQIAEYCSEDLFFTSRLYPLFHEKLIERSLQNIFVNIEMPLIPVLLRMERQGISLNSHKIAELSEMLAYQLHQLEKEIFSYTNKPFNINSPKQLSHILFHQLHIPSKKKTSLGYSTKAAILESLKPFHPIIDKILTYRSLEKLRASYVDSLPHEIHPKTHRIHSSFHQSVTTTGRLSSTDPNLQNIPKRTPEGRKIREAFQAEEKYSFVSADYSQIELRILAHLSEDAKLLEAFQKDEDIHQACAAKIFHVPLHKVSSAMRTKAKAVNFGILYGQQDFGLSQLLHITLAEASHLKHEYFKTFPQVHTFIQKCIENAQKTGRAKTLFGRERKLSDILSKNAILRARAERLAINTVIQGSQADIIKLAMIQIDKKWKEGSKKWNMILQIHDELLFECLDIEIDRLVRSISTIMENVVQLKVPLKVNFSIGKNWGEC